MFLIDDQYAPLTPKILAAIARLTPKPVRFVINTHDASSGGTPEGVVAACDPVLALASDQTRIIPGHGPLSNKAQLRAYRDMLAAVTGRS